MKKLFKLFIITLSSLVLLLFIAAIALVTFINPNDFKPQIQQKVFAITHKPLILRGDIHWSFFPNFAITSNDVQFDTIKVKQFKAQTALMPLLKGQLLIDAINLTQVEFILPKNQHFIIDHITTPLDIQNHIITLKAINAQLYQGTYHGQAIIDTKFNTPKITTNGKFTQLQTEPLLQALVGITRIQLVGIADLAIHLTMAGDLKTLNGNGSFVLNNGILKSLDIRYWIHSAQALVHKKTPTQTNTQQTPFNKLSASFTIKQGIVTNNDLLLQADDARASGRGTANLVNQQLNYELILQRVKNGELKDAPIPLMLTGAFSNISMRLNIESLAQQQLKEQIKMQIGDRLQKSLGKELGDTIGKQLNNLLH